MKHMKALSRVSTAALGRICGRHRCQVLLVAGYSAHDRILTTQEVVTGIYTTYRPLMNALLLRIFTVPIGPCWLYIATDYFVRDVHVSRNDDRFWTFGEALANSGDSLDVSYRAGHHNAFRCHIGVF